ncbi:MAG: group 1 truncated hemoglobin [Woeseiaceae bacterium]|nr:group 1 truncated hemoglobin [Woeseiaceae bacterium]
MSKKVLKGFAIFVLTMISGMITSNAFAGDDATDVPTLYERLGAWDGINKIVHDTLALHRKNPTVAHYFSDIDDEQFSAHVTAFFAAGTGGPSRYEGRDMTSAHAALNLSEADFDSAIADVLAAVSGNGVSAEAQAEVAAILESLRPAVMGTSGP